MDVRMDERMDERMGCVHEAGSYDDSGGGGWMDGSCADGAKSLERAVVAETGALEYKAR